MNRPLGDRSHNVHVDVVGNTFRELGFDLLRIPDGPESWPDYLVIESGRPLLICATARCHIGSNYEARAQHREFRDATTVRSGGRFDWTHRPFRLTKRRYERAMDSFYAVSIRRAASTYGAVVNATPEYRGLPFVVALVPGTVMGGPLFTENPYLLNRQRPPAVSGLIELVIDRRFSEAVTGMTVEQRMNWVNGANDIKVPEKENEWRLFENPRARVPVPAEFAEKCLEGSAPSLLTRATLGMTNRATP
jgi:hypothetical protein